MNHTECPRSLTSLVIGIGPRVVFQLSQTLRFHPLFWEIGPPVPFWSTQQSVYRGEYDSLLCVQLRKLTEVQMALTAVRGVYVRISGTSRCDDEVKRQMTKESDGRDMSSSSNRGLSAALISIFMLLLCDKLVVCFHVSDTWSTTRLVPDDPEFGLAIGNLTTPVGREVVLSCTVDRLGKYKVGWLKAEDQTVLTLHNKVVTQNSRISLTHDNHRTWQLHIRQVKESDRGCYMCQINTSVMKKQVVCVDVHVPPDILYDETSTDLSVQESENATLVCKATGHPPPRITWRREDGEPILLRRGPRDVIRVDAFNGSLLHFWRLDRRQMGAFLCIASNDVPPAVSKRIILNVNFAPVVKVPNQLLGAPLGTDVQLECYVEAFPNTINYWIKNRGEMLLDGPKYSIRENRSAYKVFMWLVIRSFGSTDIGTYNCVSTNSLGRAEGTLRLYEIKIYTGLPHGSTDNHVAIVGGLAEAPRGQSSRTKGGTLDNRSGSASQLGNPLTTLVALLSLSILQISFCVR